MWSRLPEEILLEILEKLPRGDLLQAILVDRQWNRVGDPLLYQHLSFPVTRDCYRCAEPLDTSDTNETQRLRVFNALLDKCRAPKIKKLSIIETEHHCVWGRLKTSEWEPNRVSFARLCLSMLTSLLSKAPSLQLIRLNLQYFMLPLDTLFQAFQPWRLEVTLPRKRLLPELRNLRHLSLHRTSAAVDGRLPQMNHLRSLDLSLERAHPFESGPLNPLIDLSDLNALKQLHIQGTIWSDLQDTFTGASCTIETCILRGPLALGNRSDTFFARVAPGLQSLFCHGVHLIGRLETLFPQLFFVALHKTIHATGFFPFCRSTLRAVSLEIDDLRGTDSSYDTNELLELVLENTRSTLKTLVFRPGAAWEPSNTIRQSLQSMTRLSSVVIDSVIGLNPSWVKSFPAPLNHFSVTIADFYTRKPVMANIVASDTITADQQEVTKASKIPVEAYCCGYQHRKAIFRSIGIDEVSFDIYIWLLSEPQISTCDHHNVMCTKSPSLILRNKSLH